MPEYIKALSGGVRYVKAAAVFQVVEIRIA
jgi:hypothetical protein